MQFNAVDGTAVSLLGHYWIHQLKWKDINCPDSVPISEPAGDVPKTFIAPLLCKDLGR